VETSRIKQVLLDQESLLEEKLSKERIIDREVNYVADLPNAYLITGPRRAGKSIYAVQMTKGRKFLRIDFEDERLYGIKANELNKVLEAGYELKGGKIELLILDEIQNVEGWELFVSRMREIYPTIVTGSNARLMSREMGTYLTGRHLDYLLLQFSFKEFLKYYNVSAEETTRGIAMVKEKLEEYIKLGGFPEAYKVISPKEYLLTLFKDIVTRDVIQRCRIRRSEINPFATFLVENTGREVTTRRLGRVFNISHQSVENYLNCLINSYLFLIVKRFTGKLVEKYVSPRKVYVIDPAFNVNLTGKVEIGRLIENLVLVELLRRKYYQKLNYEIYYYSNGQSEVDFVVNGEVKEAIQVSYDISGLEERELKGLERFSEKYKGYRLKLITWDMEGVEELKNGEKVEVIPLWKYLIASPFRNP
jgi:predicted AAA+ superfamily ATPase